MTDKFRISKVSKLREMGIDPYPYTFDQKNHASEIKGNFAKFEGKETSVAGRILRMREIGKISFLNLVDESGDLQIMVRDDALDESSKKVAELLDIGDIVGVYGKVVKTKKGEISVDAAKITMLAKSLSILPEKFHGLTDTEMRYRNRHLDLMVNLEVREYFKVRARFLAGVRDFLDSKGYVEFETPVLQPKYGGANAKPFITYYNALGTNMFLRVADELYLKRLVIGGFEKVYEVSKDFRNEDIDSTHNPEFTQVEFYEAYKDYNAYMEMTEEMLSTITKNIFGTTKIKYQGKDLDFTPPFKRIYWVDEIKKKTGIDISEVDDDEAKRIAKEEGLEVGIINAYHVADGLFDKYIRPQIWNPTFVVDYPAYMCPLTKDKRGNSKLSERFELFVAGIEVGNCYSELTDPIEQRKKFEEQEAERKKGDEEAPPSDEDFIRAIEFGMPPTAGMGLSIDRMAMILTNNKSIKEVIAFPAVRPEKH